MRPLEWKEDGSHRCVWCWSDSRNPSVGCVAPDGNGHLYEGPRDRARNPYNPRQSKEAKRWLERDGA